MGARREELISQQARRGRLSPHSRKIVVERKCGKKKGKKVPGRTSTFSTMIAEIGQF